ncbi:MAG: arsenate reductase [Novosphingobium meiothermophilum]|uniref:arsenate reductase n=1 Tax=Novosphingobium TaxID=165696 RepID=UPI000D6E0DA7|nr:MULTISPECIES: arsenate reductase [Novosphingobium]
MSITVYGIPNCDTVKKARAWLGAKGLDYTFHDYKKQGADPAQIAGWIAAAGLDRIVNRAGTTWRKLDDAQKAMLAGDDAPAVLAENPSVIKRPVVVHSGGLLVGFRESEWAEALLPQDAR